MACVLTLVEYPHQSLLLQQCSPLRQGFVGYRKSTYPKWIETAPPGLLHQQCGTWPCPWQGGDSDQAEGKPCLTPGSTRSLYLCLLLFCSTHLPCFFRWKWHLRCHVRCLSMTYSLIIIISGFYSHCCKRQNFILYSWVIFHCIYTHCIFICSSVNEHCFHLISIVSTMLLYWRRQWHPTLVLLPGKSHGRRSLVGYSPWGR